MHHKMKRCKCIIWYIELSAISLLYSITGSYLYQYCLMTAGPLAFHLMCPLHSLLFGVWEAWLFCSWTGAWAYGSTLWSQLTALWYVSQWWEALRWSGWSPHLAMFLSEVGPLDVWFELGSQPQASSSVWRTIGCSTPVNLRTSTHIRDKHRKIGSLSISQMQMKWNSNEDGRNVNTFMCWSQLKGCCQVQLTQTESCTCNLCKIHSGFINPSKCGIHL